MPRSGKIDETAARLFQTTAGERRRHNRNSPIFQMMKEQGCTSVYDVAKVSMKQIESMMKFAIESREKNAAIVKRIYSEETRLEEWKELLE